MKIQRIDSESLRKVTVRKSSDCTGLKRKTDIAPQRVSKKLYTVVNSGQEQFKTENLNRVDKYQHILKSYDKSKLHRQNIISDTISNMIKSDKYSNNNSIQFQKKTEQLQLDRLNTPKNLSNQKIDLINLKPVPIYPGGCRESTFSNYAQTQDETTSSKSNNSIQNEDSQHQQERSESMAIQDRQKWLQDIINLQEMEISNCTDSRSPQLNFISPNQTDINQSIKLDAAGSSISPRSKQRGLTMDGQHRQVLEREKEKIIQKKVKKINKIIRNMLEQLFTNIEIVPNDIRIICALIKYHAQKKYPDLTNAQLQYSLSFFFIDDWVLHIFMKSFNQYQDMDQPKQETIQKNMIYIQSIIKNIMKKQVFKEGKVQRFNSLILQLGDYVTDYYDQLMNIDMDKILNQIINPSEQSNLQFQLDFSTVYLSLENIQKFSQLVVQNETDFQQMNECKVVEYAKCIQNEGDKVFADRSDLNGQNLKKDQIYTIFQFYNTQTQQFFNQYFDLPSMKIPQQTKVQDSDLQDSTKYFNRFKQLFRTLLVNVEKLQVIAQFSGFNDLDMISILKLLEDSTCEKYNSEAVNVPLTTSYLNTMINNYLNPEYTENNLQVIWKYMSKEYKIRIKQLEKISFCEKINNVRLIKNLKTNIEQIQNQIKKIEKSKRKVAIKQFFDQYELNVCISSPQSRFKLSNASKKLYSEYDHTKIWVEDLNYCIHKQTNLDFVKDLTGEIYSTKKEQVQEHHCENLRQFLEVKNKKCFIVKIPELEQILLDGKDIWGINEAYSIILEKLEEGVKEFPSFANFTQEQQQEVIDSLFKSINKIFHRNLFPKRQSYKDAAFYILLKSLDFLTPEHLEIASNTHSEWIWKICSSTLLQMDQKKSPDQKLKCLLECTKVIAEVLQLSSLKDEAASADLTLPNLIYVLIKSKPKRIYSNLNFITAFQCKAKMISEVGYCFTQVLGSIQFIEDLTPSKLKSMSNEQFYKCLQKEELNLGISYLKKRKRNGHILDIERYNETQNQIKDQQQISEQKGRIQITEKIEQKVNQE